MSFEAFVFYFTVCLVTVSAVGVVGSSNPVYSILFLVLLFLESSILLIFLGLEFVALVLVVVYVGAVAVLFLFVCMMLNVRQEATSTGALELLPVALFFAFLIAAYFVPILYTPVFPYTVDPVYQYVDWLSVLNSVQSVHALAIVLYGAKSFEFTLAALILLSAMVIGISVTLWKRVDLRQRKLEAGYARLKASTNKYYRSTKRKE